MRILDLALKDLSQMFRDKRSLLFLVVMPIVFTFFMGFAYKNAGGDKNADNRIPLAVVNPEPDAVLNSALVARLEASDAIRIESMVETDAMNALHKGDVAGVLKIPAGFSEQANGGREAEAQLTLIADSTSASGQSLYQLLRVPISQLMSAVEISRETVDTVGATDKSAEQSAAFDLAWSKWTEASKISLVQVEEAVAEKSADWTGGNPYNQSSPGILVQFAIFGLVTSAQILVQEKKSRTLQRLITTAMKPWEIVAGHMLAMFTITFLQTAMLVVFGQWVLKVDYLREPLGVLLVSVTLGLWVASMGLLIGVIAKEEQQVILFAMIAMFLFSAMGGTWFPLETTGGAFAAIGKAMPSAWAMNGLQNILIRGLGLESVWLAVGILSAYALGFFLLAVWRFRRMEA
ncbi:MAG TPA: ABC transporter permease [Anaerolineales bacterium]|nr:ABC transporter permease [Anaerolineales bacterium]